MAQGSVPWHKAAEADEAIGSAYLKLVSLKLAFDAFDELPAGIKPLYQAVCGAIGALVVTRKETNQVRFLAERAARR